MTITSDTSIHDIAEAENFSARALNVCLSAGFTTLGELIEFSREKLVKLPNCGTKTLSELEMVRNKYAGKITRSFTGIDIHNPHLLREFTDSCLLPALDSVESAAEAADRQLLTEAIGDPEDFAAASLSGTNQFLKQMLDCVEPAHRARLSGMLTGLYSACAGNLPADSEERKAIVERLGYLEKLAADNDFEDFYYTLSQRARKLLNFSYLRMFDKLPMRTRNVLADYREFELILPYLFGRQRFTSSDLTRCGKKAFTEINTLVDTVRQAYVRFVNQVRGAGDGLEQWFFDAERTTMAEIYPFLHSDEIKRIVATDLPLNRLPRLAVMLRYIQRTEARSTEAYALIYGFSGREPMEMKAVAEEMGVASERIRQLLCEGVRVPDTMTRLIEKLREELTDDIYPPYHPLWRAIIERERVSMPVIATLTPEQMMGLFLAVSPDYMAVKVNWLSTIYMVRREVMHNVKFNTSIQKLRQQVNSPNTSESHVSFADVLLLGRDRSCLSPRAGKLFPLLADCVRSNPRVTIDNDGRGLTVTPNKVEIGPAVEQMLRENGKPMSFAEIINKFHQRYPYIAINSFDSFKNYVLRHPTIGHIGRTERYMLKSWDHSYCGSMKDYLEKILRESELPLSLYDICDRAREHFPDAKLHSINVQICSDKRFKSFGKWYFGLADRDYPEQWERRILTPRTTAPEKRMAQLREFVATNGRLPFSTSEEEEEESTLYRWYKRTLYSNSASCTEVRRQLRQFLDEHPWLPSGLSGLNFRLMTDRVLAIIKAKGRRPDPKREPEEATWLRRTLRSKTAFGDSRDHDLARLHSALLGLA